MSSKRFGRAFAMLAVALTPIVVTAQRSGTSERSAAAKPVQKPAAVTQKLPPLSYVCPMPGDEGVLEDKPGRCEKCGMELKPIRLDLRYGCPVHQAFIQKGAGKHPYDGRELVPVTVSVFWTCGEARFLEPGKCSDGSVRNEQYEQRPHGDHNPKHGGQFFMAPDAWHHLEGTYPIAGIFRMFFYNDYSKPLKATGFTATLSMLDASDKEMPGLTNIPLKPGRSSNTMEAAIPKDKSVLPLRLLARVKFTPTSDANAFNFTFDQITREPASTSTPAAVTTRATTPAPATPTAPTPQQATPAPVTIAPQDPQIAPTQAPSALVAALDESSLPTATPDLIAELAKRAGEVEQMVKDGNLGQVWLPAMSTKTVALVLESHTNTLPESQRAVASVAIKRVVTSAWELDAYGDLGNKQKMTEAYQKLSAAVADLKAVYGSR